LAKKDKYLVGLDIGSTKNLRFAWRKSKMSSCAFWRWGRRKSKGLRKGLIVNLDSTVSSIRRACGRKPKAVANVPVESAVIGVAGSHGAAASTAAAAISLGKPGTRH